MIEGSADSNVTGKLKYGMVGGGQGAFIGDVHRKSINLDGMAEIAAGCFSRSYDNTLATGASLGISKDRLYKTYEEMAEEESKRADKIDFVVIITPNDSHFAIAKLFLDKGIHIVCDKPLTLELEEAEELAELAAKNKLLFAVTYTYTGYPAVKQIREMIRRGEIGDIRFVNAEYPQEWLAAPIEKSGHKQALWRLDPQFSGKTNCVGDIGTHIENMVSCMTGLKIKALCARLDKFVEGRVLDDNASIMVEYESPSEGKPGPKGLYWSCQVAIGFENGLRVRIFGDKGAIQWCQEQPDRFEVSRLGKPKEHWSRGREAFYPLAQSFVRIPSGHPEGVFEAMANIYKAFAAALIKVKAGQTPSECDLDFPGVETGVNGVKFIEKCVESSNKGAIWINY